MTTDDAIPPRPTTTIHHESNADQDVQMTASKEQRARAALQELSLEIADKWATGFQQRPTQQLVLQKILDPAVRHVMNAIFPWIIGGAVLFLILFVCTVVTCFIVIRSGLMVPASTTATAATAIMAGMAAAGLSV